MTHNPTISVIVPTYNEERHIRRCLESLLLQTLPRSEYEIIVSDSSSTDATAGIARALADRVVVCRKVSAGFGRNYGARFAHGSVLAFIDGDSAASPRWLEGVKESMGGSIASTGPIRALGGGGLMTRGFYLWWSAQSFITTMLRRPIFPGFNMALSRSHFLRIGGFTEKNITTEDIDLSFRVARLGSVSYNRKMAVFTSARRIEDMGILRYVMNGIRYVLMKRSHGWEDHRNDFSTGASPGASH